MNPPNTNSLWTGQNASGFPVYDAVDVDLAPYAGTLDAQIRFRALIDPAAAEPGGWYVDDIVVDDVVAFGACASACVQPPTAVLPDALACTSATDPVDVALDASASLAGPAGLAPDLAYVFTHDGPGSFGGRRWAAGPRAVLTFPAGTPAGAPQVTLTVRGGDTCSDVHVATVTLADEGPLPARVGPTLRVAKAVGGGLTLSWTDVGASTYNAILLPIGADLSRIASAAPAARPAGSPARLASGLAATGAGTAFIEVDSASSCGRSLP